MSDKLFQKALNYEVLLTVNEVDYVHSGDDTQTIVALSREHGLAVDTGFYDTDDFDGPYSDYAFVVHEDKLIPTFERDNLVNDMAEPG